MMPVPRKVVREGSSGMKVSRTMGRSPTASKEVCAARAAGLQRPWEAMGMRRMDRTDPARCTATSALAGMGRSGNGRGSGPDLAPMASATLVGP
jgi:hypothetical protein